MFALLLVVLSSGCGHRNLVQYQPKPYEDQAQALRTIERAIRAQPPAYQVAPHQISVKDDCIQMIALEEKREFLGPRYTETEPKTICFKNIGQVLLKSSRIWYVEIYDREGYWMYTVYSYDEADAKGFVDALHTMMGSK